MVRGLRYPGFTRVDHVTYAVAPGRIEQWARFYVDICGGELVTQIDDIAPESPHSSMKLWCIRFPEFGIALVEGIDRLRESQVSAFVRGHGDHSVQHVAFAVENLATFLCHLNEHGIRLRGEVVTRTDGFGAIKQVFTKGVTTGDPAMTPFFEFVERPQQGNEMPNVSFSSSVGKSFYDQIEEARDRKDTEALLDMHPRFRLCETNDIANGVAAHRVSCL